MINNIVGLIFVGVIISLTISNGFNINKMERAARKLAFQAISDTRKAPLPSLKGIPSPNPFGCGTYKCHKEKLKRFGIS